MALRFVGLVLAVLATALSGCDSPGGGSLLRQGIGTDLSHAGLAQATTLQDRYVALICRQAGLGAFASEEGCADQSFRAADWSAFVQAGMNDIDARCDAYLAWLDERRRSAGPILQQISDIRTATTAILALSGVGVDPIAIVSAAFGLASGTFTNVNSRLLLQLDQSTVQAVVLSRQTEFRQMLRAPDQRIANRPDAIHVLRSYLRICSPFTIETDINTTITTLARGGAAAIDRQAPLVETTPSNARPFTPDSRAQQPERGVRHSRVDAYAALIADYQPSKHTTGTVQKALAALCVRQTGPSVVDRETPDLIAVFHETPRPREATPRADRGSSVGETLPQDQAGEARPASSRKLNTRDIDFLSGRPACSAIHRNFYEVWNYSDGLLPKGSADRISKLLPPTDAIAGNTPLDQARGRIRSARGKLAEQKQLRQSDPFFADHITNDLIRQ